MSDRDKGLNESRDKDRDNETKAKPKKPNFLQVVNSILAAGIGVQSSKNRQRDFQHGSHKVFIIAGLIFTGLFLLGIYTVVQLVLK